MLKIFILSSISFSFVSQTQYLPSLLSPIKLNLLSFAGGDWFGFARFGVIVIGF